jgi:replication-associated recombination protein RarA
MDSQSHVAEASTMTAYILPPDPMQLRTTRGYNFSEVSSAMQNAIRRAEAKLAGNWALELSASGFGRYVWKRLLTISAEECWGIITQEVKALQDGYLVVNENVPARQPKGRNFISKAVILLCLAKESRDVDHLQNFVYDQTAGLEEKKLTKALGQRAITCHTRLRLRLPHGQGEEDRLVKC